MTLSRKEIERDRAVVVRCGMQLASRVVEKRHMEPLKMLNMSGLCIGQARQNPKLPAPPQLSWPIGSKHWM